MAGFRSLLVVLFSLLFVSGAASAAERAIIVLDGSGSMWAQIDGTARIEIARDTLNEVLGGLPADLELGLMTYGAREKGNCADIQVLVPPGVGTAAAISAAAAKINPKGKTPLSDAVRLAADALQYTEERATVILITDGLETCNADPCALGAELESRGIDFTVDVLGFGLSDEDGQKVACLAENTGGKYLSASDGDSLVAALTETVAEAAAPEPPPPPPPPEPAKPEFNLVPTLSLAEGAPDYENDQVLFEILVRNEDGSPGKSLAAGYGTDFRRYVPPGAYVVRAKLGEARQAQTIDIAEGEVAAPHFVMNAGFIDLTAKLGPDEPASTKAKFIVRGGGDEWAWYEKARTFLPEGDYEITAEIGSAHVTEPVTITAGEAFAKDFVLAAGVAAISAVYAEGVPVEDDGMSVEVFEAKKDIQGKRKSVEHAYDHAPMFSLNAGDYVAMAKLGDARAEIAFTVEADTRVEPVIDFNAGVLAVSAPGMDSAEVFTAKTDLEGKRKSVAHAYGEITQFVIPAGDYVVVIKPKTGETVRSVEVAVTAGERSEIAVK